MIKKIVVLFALNVILIPAFSQDVTTTTTDQNTTTTSEKRDGLSADKAGLPDIPGVFTLELGLNRLQDGPSDIKSGFWGSRTLNIYYQYEIRILKSKFFLVPGVGFSLERYKFKDGNILAYNAGVLAMYKPEDLGLSGVKKSQLITNYFEVPVEICFRTRPDDPARSFKISVGGRIGYLFDSFTKVKYKEDGEVKKYKDKQDFQLTKIRYGLSGRIGVGNVSLFGYYNLTPLFESGEGPVLNGKTTEFSTITIGLSLASF
jgi:hypothetical protein